jgi:hypothetical protein
MEIKENLIILRASVTTAPPRVAFHKTLLPSSPIESSVDPVVDGGVLRMKCKLRRFAAWRL